MTGIFCQHKCSIFQNKTSMNRPIKIALVGCGEWGKHYLRVFSGVPDVEMKAVVDPREERQAFAKSLVPGISASIKKYHHEEVGLNSRLDTLQAAVLLVKMKRLADWNNRRRKIAAIYDSLLAGIPEIKLTKTDPGSVYHIYVIRVRERDVVLKSLQDRGIGAGIHYPFPVHLLGAYKWLGYSKGAFPVAEAWAESCLSLPIFPEMTEDQVSTVVSTLKEALARNL